MSWGGHRVAQHMGHVPGEQQRTPFFRLLFKGRKTYQNGVFRFFGFPFKDVTVEDRHMLLCLQMDIVEFGLDMAIQVETHCLVRLCSDTI